jgi:lipid A 4'-phosphatase
MTRAIVWLLAALAAAVTIFALAPSLDIAASRQFFDGTAFPVANNRVIETLRRVLIWVEDAAGLLAFPLAGLAARPGRPLLGQGARVWLFQGLVFLLGPAILVNGILKPLWSRPRPYNITDFGGTADFQPITQIGGACLRSCSFSSGEMAGATALTIMAVMLIRAHRTWLAGLVPLALAAAMAPMPFTAWQRMAAGKHFLSDVVISALLVALIAAVLARALRPSPTQSLC